MNAIVSTLEKKKSVFTRKRAVISAASLVLLLGLGFGIYAAVRQAQEDRKLAFIKEKFEEMRNPENLPKTPEEMKARGEEMQKAFYTISKEGRDKLMREGMEQRKKIENEKLSKFFAASKVEQRKMLDEDIKQQEERSKQIEKWMKERDKGGPNFFAMGGAPPGGGAGGPGGAGAGGPGGAGAAGNNVQSGGFGTRNATGNASGATGIGANPATGGPGGPPPNQPSREQMNQFRKNMLDMFTPEERAQRAEYSSMMATRRQQLGMPPQNGPGFMGFGGPIVIGGQPAGGGGAAPKRTN